MGDERLLSIKNDNAKNLDWITSVNEFAEIKTRTFPSKIMKIV